MNTISRIFERTSSKPVESFVPNQALDLKTIIQRFERGQRLNVHLNFRPKSNMTDGSLYVEDFNDAPPDDIHDVVDVEQHLREHHARKEAYSNKKKEAKQAPDAKKEEAPQAPADPTPQE